MSIGIVRSASRNAIGSPVAAFTPARTAAPFPLCGRCRTLKVSPACGRAVFARWKMSTVAVAVPFRALACLVAVAIALAHRAHREVDPALPVDLGDLDGHRVTDLDDVLDPADAILRQLGDPHEAFLAREVLDERADAHDPRDLALVDLADLGLLRQPLDHRPRLLAALGLRAGDAHGAVVLELDRRRGLGLDRTDHLATGADDLAHLVRRDLDGLDPRRPAREVRSRRVDDLAHRVENRHPRLARLREGALDDLDREAPYLDVELDPGDAALRARDLEVHVAVVVFHALDVGE